MCCHETHPSPPLHPPPLPPPTQTGQPPPQTVDAPEGNGTGFVYDTQGNIVTNYHVLGNVLRGLGSNAKQGIKVARVALTSMCGGGVLGGVGGWTESWVGGVVECACEQNVIHIQCTTIHYPIHSCTQHPYPIHSYTTPIPCLLLYTTHTTTHPPGLTAPEGVIQNFDATLVGVDRTKDLAVIRINAPPSLLRPVVLGDSDVLRVGQQTLAIGNPFGFSSSLTTGVVSGLGRGIQSRAGVLIGGGIQTVWGGAGGSGGGCGGVGSRDGVGECGNCMCKTTLTQDA